MPLGHAEPAVELATYELDRARHGGITRAVIRNLRVLGLAIGGRDGIERLREAVEIGEASAPRLETLRALSDYGAALRRANRRTEAREP